MHWLAATVRECDNICIVGDDKFHLHDHDKQQRVVHEFQAFLLSRKELISIVNLHISTQNNLRSNK